jgi:hypothetical protein
MIYPGTTVEIVSGNQNVMSMYITGEFTVKGSTTYDRPTITPTYVNGVSQPWLNLTSAFVTLTNLIIYHTYNSTWTNIATSSCLFYLFNESNLVVSYVTFMTQNPGMVIINPIFVNWFSSVFNISDCDFTNISFQGCPLFFEDYFGDVYFTSCNFRFNFFIFLLYFLFICVCVVT